MLGWKEKHNTSKTNNITQGNKSEGIDERRKDKRYRYRIKQYRKNKAFQNNERRFYQQVTGKCMKTYQQLDDKETKQVGAKYGSITEK